MGAGPIQITFALLFGVICLAPHSALSNSPYERVAAMAVKAADYGDEDNKSQRLGEVIVANQLAITQALKTLIENTNKPECTKPFFAVDSECFLLFKDGFTWFEAKTACEVAGGNLAQPKNPLILTQFLREQTQAEPENWPIYHWWIGGKLIRDQPWQWDSGRAIESSYWYAHHHPVFLAAADERCLTLNLVHPPLKTYACQAKFQFICQF